MIMSLPNYADGISNDWDRVGRETEIIREDKL